MKSRLAATRRARRPRSAGRDQKIYFCPPVAVSIAFGTIMLAGVVGAWLGLGAADEVRKLDHRAAATAAIQDGTEETR